MVYNVKTTRPRDPAVVVTPRAEEELHDHDFMEVVLVLGGTGLHRTAAGTRAIGSGDAFVFRPGAWHGYERSRRLDIYNCCFGTQLLQRELAWTLGDPHLGWLLWNGPLTPGRHGMASFRVPRDALAPCVGELDRLRRLTSLQAGAGPASLVGQLLNVLGELANHVDPAARPTLAGVHRAVGTILRLFETQLARPWQLEDLARSTDLDGAYLSRLFKATTGLPPLAYLMSARAERAAMLLLRTTRSIGEIATDVGWPDPIYFARRFKAHFGLTATTYRRQFLRSAPAAD